MFKCSKKSFKFPPAGYFQVSTNCTVYKAIYKNVAHFPPQAYHDKYLSFYPFQSIIVLSNRLNPFVVL